MFVMGFISIGFDFDLAKILAWKCTSDTTYLVSSGMSTLISQSIMVIVDLFC